MQLQDKEANVYSLLEKEIKENILSGKINFEKPILGETCLAEKYNISRKSVRKALQNLTVQGLLRKVQGRGTFVIPPGERIRLPANKFLNILLIIPWYENGTSEFDELLIDGVSEYCFRTGHKIMYSGYKVSAEDIIYKHSYEFLDGVIWTQPEKKYENLIKRLRDRKIPQLLVNREYDGVCSIVPDSFKALDDCVTFLAGIGHKKIGFVNLDSNVKVFMERKQAYLDSMKKIGVKNPETYYSASVQDKIPLSFENLFTRNPQITALILGGILFTVPFLIWSSGENIRIPEDVSLINIDDSYKAKTHKTPISVYTEPRNEVGRRAVMMLENIIRDNVLPGERTKMDGELIIRKTCASPKEK